MGRGKGIGTGVPLTFRCAKCKVGRDYQSPRSWDQEKGTHYVATGLTKPMPWYRGRSPIRRAKQLTQYRCLICGHIGWSSHSDMDRALAKRERGYS